MFSYMVLCPSEPRIVSIHCGVMSSVSGFFQGVLVYAPGAIFFPAVISLWIALCGSSADM